MFHINIKRVATLEFIYKDSLNNNKILVFIASFFFCLFSLYSLNHGKKNTAM